MFDLLLTALVVVLTFFLRLEANQVYIDYPLTIGWMVLVSLLLKPLIYRRFGLYQRFWAYASMREALTITLAVTAASIAVTIMMFALLAMFLSMEQHNHIVPTEDYLIIGVFAVFFLGILVWYLRSLLPASAG